MAVVAWEAARATVKEAMEMVAVAAKAVAVVVVAKATATCQGVARVGLESCGSKVNGSSSSWASDNPLTRPFLR